MKTLEGVAVQQYGALFAGDVCPAALAAFLVPRALRRRRTRPSEGVVFLAFRNRRSYSRYFLHPVLRDAPRVPCASGASPSASSALAF